MSKLANAVYVHNTGQRYPKEVPLNALMVTEKWTTLSTPPIDTEYRIGVSLEHNIRLTAEIMHTAEAAALAEAVKMVKEAIVEEIFGEFRPHFRAINLALLNQDIDAARAAVRAMETQMFSAEN